MIQTEVLIIGSGLAGLFAALKLAPEAGVTLITKRGMAETNTSKAQGGIAAVLRPDDSFEAHIEDTLRTGQGLCDPDVVRKVVQDGPGLVRELIAMGVPFSKTEGGELDLTTEGGHQRHRVAHAADATGEAIQNALAELCRRHPNIRILENHMAVDLLTNRHIPRNLRPPLPQCFGAYVLNTSTNEVLMIQAKLTLLATGGAGKVYLYTSNPDTATGDGMALALRAGCPLANMEFVQFHPTCLFSAQAKNFLISESLRGEGGKLRLLNGESFMEKYDRRGELATRDIVARAIDFELKKRGDPYVLLDIQHKPAGWIRERFPTIYENCLRFGLDITREPIPVVPAAHYFCGGVPTDLNGRTPIPRLLACGETACTGLHGANRLASNSLLEAAAFAGYAAEEAKKRLPDIAWNENIRPWNPMGTTDSDEEVVIVQNWEEVRTFMWNYVGIVRSSKRLARAKSRIELLLREIEEYYWNFRITRDLLELRNITLVARAIIDAALRRKENRGLHFNMDKGPVSPLAK